MTTQRASFVGFIAVLAIAIGPSVGTAIETPCTDGLLERRQADVQLAYFGPCS